MALYSSAVFKPAFRPRSINVRWSVRRISISYPGFESPMTQFPGRLVVTGFSSAPRSTALFMPNRTCPFSLSANLTQGLERRLFLEIDSAWQPVLGGLRACYSMFSFGINRRLGMFQFITRLINRVKAAMRVRWFDLIGSPWLKPQWRNELRFL